jgi:catechol-2,3-dioxygenase
MKEKPKTKPLHPMVGIGHVHLKVTDLEHAIAFYGDVLGFELTQRYGRQAAFLSAGGYHHHNMVTNPLDLEALRKEAAEQGHSARKQSSV